MNNECDDFPILNVSGSYIERLVTVLELAPYQYARAYFASDEKLVFFWSAEQLPPHAHLLPGKANAELMASLVKSWLNETAKYPEEPNHDGSNTKGWRVYCDSWGMVEGFGHYSFVAIVPHWIMHGK